MMELGTSTTRVLKALQDYYRKQAEENLYPIVPPTYRELCDLVGVNSTSVIFHHVLVLLEAGLLERGHNRAVYLTEAGMNYGNTE